MADFRAYAVAGDAQTAQTSTLTLTVPAAAQAADYALIFVNVSTATVTLGTPTGWTLLSGPDVSSSSTSWAFGRSLTSSDPGTSVVLTLSNNRRAVAQMAVYRDVTATGLTIQSNIHAATTAPVLPSASSVSAGSALHAVWVSRFNGTPATDITPPAGYTQPAGNRVATAFGSSPEMSLESAHRVVSSAGTYGGETAAASSSASGATYLVTLRSLTAATETAVDAPAVRFTVDAPAPAVDTGAVIVDAAPARATVQMSPPTLPVVIAPSATATEDAVFPPAPYREAIRNGVGLYYTVDAYYGGEPVAGATDLRPTGGTITDTTRPGVRRTLTLELPDQPGLFDALAPIGTELHVTAHVRYTSRATQTLPMGVFDVDAQTLSESSGGISLTAPDRWVRLQRAKFLRPQGSMRGVKVVDQITALIREVFGSSMPVTVRATSTATVGALVWERDRDQAVIDLAQQIGAWVYFDRDGYAVIADLPTLGAFSNWLIDASASGVLIDLDRERSRADTCNVVVVNSSAADGARFKTVYCWDNDPDSPTYAGPGSGASNTPPPPAAAGPFGLVPYFFSTPILTSVGAAQATGLTILARVTGLASQVSLAAVPNPALDAFDVIDVLPPGREVAAVRVISSTGGYGTVPYGTGPFGEGSGGDRPWVTYRSTRPVERHVCDTVTHPLAGGEQRIEGRSTRTDGYTGGGE